MEGRILGHLLFRSWAGWRSVWSCNTVLLLLLSNNQHLQHFTQSQGFHVLCRIFADSGASHCCTWNPYSSFLLSVSSGFRVCFWVLEKCRCGLCPTLPVFRRHLKLSCTSLNFLQLEASISVHGAAAELMMSSGLVLGSQKMYIWAISCFTSKM